MLEYIFLKTDKNKFGQLSKKTQDLLNNSKSIHLYQTNKEGFDFENQCIDKDIFVYCSNEATISSCLDQYQIPHYCFFGDDIFSETKQQEFKKLKNIDDNIETFWFPNITNITFKIETFLNIVNTLKSLNSGICISFSEIFENIYAKNQDFLVKIHTLFDNPLYKREVELLENETFSNQNLFIKEQNSQVEMKKIILGLFGDELLDVNLSEEEVLDKSKNILQKTKECLMCENFNYCANRGLGIILNTYQEKRCIGIKIFEKCK